MTTNLKKKKHETIRQNQDIFHEANKKDAQVKLQFKRNSRFTAQAQELRTQAHDELQGRERTYGNADAEQRI